MARRGRRQRPPPLSPTDPAGPTARAAGPPGQDTPPGAPQPPIDTSDPEGAPPPEETQKERDTGTKRAPKPTLEDVENWVRRDRQHWAKRDERMQRHHKLWRLDKPARDRTQNMILVTTNDPKVFIEKATAMAVAKD